ncbi:hypothetical protein [Streptomyces chromofuscus]|uniref:hypothetical protein n=1 Tax=Streptomyces chromofuscus TaxID=42881 RepID=UPI001996E685|nr:hypothetical protein [Streptomyces chromofuscus]GGT01658.1 hypothetical protein GCM10010254_22450 [Streptomyces chromofuscus]
MARVSTGCLSSSLQLKSPCDWRAGLLVEHLHAHGVDVPHRPDGLNVWVELDVDARVAVTALARRGWTVRPGHFFAPDPAADQGAIQVTASTVTEPQTEAFAAELAAVVTELRFAAG